MFRTHDPGGRLMRTQHVTVLASTAVLVALSITLASCGGGGNEATPSGYGATRAATAKPSPAGQALTTGTATPVASPTSGGVTVQVANNSSLGKMILVNAQGMTLYRYDKDTQG